MTAPSSSSSLRSTAPPCGRCACSTSLITFHLNLTRATPVVRYSSKEEAAKAQSLHMCVPLPSSPRTSPAAMPAASAWAPGGSRASEAQRAPRALVSTGSWSEAGSPQCGQDHLPKASARLAHSCLHVTRLSAYPDFLSF